LSLGLDPLKITSENTYKISQILKNIAPIIHINAIRNRDTINTLTLSATKFFFLKYRLQNIAHKRLKIVKTSATIDNIRNAFSMSVLL
jgi:glutamate racemase